MVNRFRFSKSARSGVVIALSAMLAIPAGAASTNVSSAKGHPALTHSRSGPALGASIPPRQIVKTVENGVSVWRPTISKRPAPAPKAKELLGGEPVPAPVVRKRIVTRKIIKPRVPPRKLRVSGFYSGFGEQLPIVQGFYSGKPQGRRQKFVQGFYSGYESSRKRRFPLERPNGYRRAR